MELFRRGGQNQFSAGGQPGWLRLVVYGLAAFVVAIALVFGGRWLYRSIHHSPGQVVQQPSNTPKLTTPKSPPSPSSGSQTPSNTSPSPNSNTKLPQNGPGDVVALFVGTSLAAAGLHYLFQLRRQLS